MIQRVFLRLVNWHLLYDHQNKERIRKNEGILDFLIELQIQFVRDRAVQTTSYMNNLHAISRKEQDISEYLE